MAKKRRGSLDLDRKPKLLESPFAIHIRQHQHIEDTNEEKRQRRHKEEIAREDPAEE